MERIEEWRRRSPAWCIASRHGNTWSASPRFRQTSTISVVALPYTWSGLRLAASRVVEEIIAGGSTLVKVIRGQGRLKSYCAIFRKPEAGP
jgi:hypothetical protein